LLAILEADDAASGKRATKARPVDESVEQQLDFFGTPTAVVEVSPVLEALRGLELNGMTPLEALNKLYELQGKAGE
jgi:DNA mismatch repair protein MutS